jgi:hypothetical protein
LGVKAAINMRRWRCRRAFGHQQRSGRRPEQNVNAAFLKWISLSAVTKASRTNS